MTDEGIALHGADNRQPRARVAARQLHDRLTGAQLPGRLGVLDHLPGDPILLREAGIEVIELGQDAAVKVASDSREGDERGLPDRLDGGVENPIVARHGVPQPREPAPSRRRDGPSGTHHGVGGAV
jgi:hypothetical protein